VHDIIQSRIPPGERCQRVRVTTTDMSALATQVDQVLPELVAQLRDLQVAHRRTVQTSSPRLKFVFLDECASNGRGRGVPVSSTFGA
jgi:hypothetical protein